MTVTQHDPWSSVHQVLERYERLLAGPYPDDECYGWEPWPLKAWLDGMLDIKCRIEERTKASGTNGRFLDVGCGVGTKLVLAYLLGWEDVTGIELRPHYAEVARKICPEATIIETDSRDFQGYGAFDIIYMYRPLIAEEDQRLLIKDIESQLKPGAVFWSV